MTEFKPPTYEEYLKATDFARMRYKYGLFVTAGAIVCLLILIAFVFIYAKELSTEPLNYAAEKYDIMCTCYKYDNSYKYEFNATQTYITEIESEWMIPYLEIES